MTSPVQLAEDFGDLGGEIARHQEIISKLAAERREIARKLVASGLTYKQLGELTGVTGVRIYQLASKKER